MRGAPVILGLGGVAAAAAAAYFGGLAGPKRPDAPSTSAEAPSAVAVRRDDGTNDKICVRADIGFAETKKGGCYFRRDFAAMERSQVLDAQGAPVRVSLAHPTDYEREPTQVSTCAEYNGLVESGWYALAESEMRREAYFKRACGVLSMLERARTPDLSHFANEAMTDADMQSLAKGPPFRIGGDPGVPDVAATVGRSAEGGWTLSANGQKATMQEIAHADFNADGLGDMLVFVSISVEHGSATAAEVGLVEKKTANGPCAYAAALGG